MKRLHVHAAADDIDRTVLEDTPDLGSIKRRACCTQQTPQGECCAPKPELAADAPCCGARAAVSA